MTLQDCQIMDSTTDGVSDIIFDFGFTAYQREHGLRLTPLLAFSFFRGMLLQRGGAIISNGDLTLDGGSFSGNSVSFTFVIL